MRVITKPVGVDTIEKLDAWLLDCGMPQRIMEDDETHEFRVVKICISSDFESESQVPGIALEAENRVFTQAASRLYGMFVAVPAQAQIVWAVSPESTELVVWDELYHKDGSDTDYVTGKSCFFVNKRRTIKFYARFWLEDAA